MTENWQYEVLYCRFRCAEEENALKNKKVLYIVILQLVCVIITVVLLTVIKVSNENLFGKIKDKHDNYFNEETVILEEQESAVAASAAVSEHLIDNSLAVPLYGTITSTFGYRNDPFTSDYVKHYGIDIAGDKGEEILSAADGEVSFVGVDKNGYGNYLKIKHNDSLVTLYGHCSKITVKKGDKVSKGQPVALVGSTGRSTGNHLHFEMIVNGVPVNAMWYMEF